MAKFTVHKSRESYEDGGEDYVLNTIENAKNRSAFSPELESAITDWASEYHFSGERLNLLSVIKLTQGMQVLDIGGGTGIISRYLADKGCVITLLEGELVRAKSAYARLETFEDAEVIVGEISDLPTDRKFDLIIICGVLEYVGLAQSEQWLKRVTSHLKESGSLFLAIENKIGLKYWLGYPEDHTGVVFDGLMDYSGHNAPRTYGSSELRNKISAAGLTEMKFFYPFPDYKKPRQIISDSGANLLSPSEIYSLITNPFADYAGISNIKIDKSAVFKTVLENSLLNEMANSFIVIASQLNASQKLYEDELLIVRCDSSIRKSEFRRWKYLMSGNSTEEFKWVSVPQGADIASPDASVHLFERGRNLSELLLEAPDKRAVGQLLEKWKMEISKAIFNEFETEFDRKHKISCSYQLIAQCGGHHMISKVDIGPSNYILDDNGNLVDIDLEWLANNSVCAELAILRALYYSEFRLLNKLAAGHGRNNLGELISRIASTLIPDEPKHNLSDFIECEVNFLELTHNINKEIIRKHISSSLLTKEVDFSLKTLLRSQIAKSTILKEIYKRLLNFRRGWRG